MTMPKSRPGITAVRIPGGLAITIDAKPLTVRDRACIARSTMALRADADYLASRIIAAPDRPRAIIR